MSCMRRVLSVLLTSVALVVAGLSVPAPASAKALPLALDLAPDVKQLITVTSDRWSATRAQMSMWRKRSDGWHRVRGPVTVRLGWNGWVPAGKRKQSTGTTPAGRFSMPSTFGNRADPGAEIRYRHADDSDVWPYEPRDPATYNIYQSRKAKASRWRSDYYERLASYGREYAYGVVLDFNLPRGVHWSKKRQQRVARQPADTSRGGGIFLHVRKSTYTAGCVAGPIKQIRWVVRWLDPDLSPRIVMGPERWVRRKL